MEEVEYRYGDLASIVAQGTYLNRAAANEEQIQLKEDDIMLDEGSHLDAVLNFDL
ncbi:hypothetical protein KI387_005507, partial [Taxus chinensis]